MPDLKLRIKSPVLLRLSATPGKTIYPVRVGEKGNTGANVELSKNDTYLLWRVAGASTWNNLIALSALRGAPGNPIEITVVIGFICFREVGSEGEWIPIIAIADLIGPKGDKGDTGSKGDTGAAGSKGDQGDPGPKAKHITGLTLSSGSWSLVNSLYEYDLSNVNITAASVVEVIPDNADIDVVRDAEILPGTDSSEGSVKIYAVNAPTDDIGVTLVIIEGV